MLLIYVTYIFVVDMYYNNPNLDKILATFGILGAINLPIIKFSTEYWNTLHQPSSFFRRQGVAIASEFLIPLVIMFFALIALYAILLLLGVSISLMKIKIKDNQVKRKIKIPV